MDDKRIRIDKLDKTTIDEISSNVVRALTEIAREDPEAQGKFHLKVGHIRIGGEFTRTVFIKIGGGPPDDDDDLETPGG